MKTPQSSPSGRRRIVIWLIIISVTAALLVWLLCKLDSSVTPMLAQSLITPMS